MDKPLEKLGHDKETPPKVPLFGGSDPKESPHEYTPEGIREDIENKCKIIREWAEKKGFVEGQDFIIIDDVTQVEGKETIAPHELKSFAVIFHESKYDEFRDFILSDEYRVKRSEYLGKTPLPKLDYSWAGRFLVGWDGVPFDTAAVLDFGSMGGGGFDVGQLKNARGATHHTLFKQLFREEFESEFPSIDKLNALLSRIAKEGLDKYKEALVKLKDMRERRTLPDDGYGLIDSLEHKIMTLEDALFGNALKELDDVIVGPMPPKMRHYADLTYNIDDMDGELDRVVEITGIEFPNRIRVDRLFDEILGKEFDPKAMEELCADFRDWLKISKEL